MYVSIIIPAYNAQNTIEYCLNSCLSQIDFIKEIIIVDDHSTDNTVELIEKIRLNYPEKIRWYMNIGKGANRARNFGLSKASGEFIQWLDADDELGEVKLKKQVGFLLENPEYDIAYTDWILKIVQPDGNYIKEHKKEKQIDDFILKLLVDEWLPPHSYLLKNNVALKIVENGGWNVNSAVYQDREFFTIAALLGFKFGHVENINVIYYRYLNVFSVSKAKVETKNLALYNLVQRIKEIISINSLNLEIIQKNALLSLELLASMNLKRPIPINVNPININWRIFPGKRLKLKVFFMMLTNRNSVF